MKLETLNGLWQMKNTESQKMLPVEIPGSVLSCLIKEKEIEDPYYRDNEYAVRELFWKDYEFQRKFQVEKELLDEENVDLVCHGLDTLCEIYVNGALLGKTNNMHRTWKFPIKGQLVLGENDIHIIIRSSLQYMSNYKTDEKKEIKYTPCGGMKGNQFMRKAHSMFGWDWGPQLPDAGIFRDIELEAYSYGRLNDVLIHQYHGEGEVKLEVDVTLQTFLNKEYELYATLHFIEEDEKKPIEVWDIVELGMDKKILNLEVKDPQIWWPNGFGKQPLYKLKVILRHKGNKIDEKEFTIGLRTLTVSQDKDQWGSEFCFQVNGIKIFSKGANYIPEDCVYSRITPEKIEYLVASSVRANYNTLRVWGGGYYPSNTFYKLCDEYGLIVWQDLMYACNVYEVTDEFEESIIAETVDNVKRLRHHACLGMWCGNNEIESAWHHWQDFQPHSDYLRMDYIKQFEFLLPKAVTQNDSQTFYWPSSPSSGGCFDGPDDENRGDTHYWAVWHGQKPFSDYQNYFFRFCSEFGFQSFPSLKTVLTYTEEEDRNIFSKIMESHQKNDAANGKMLYYLSENFQYPKDFDSLLYSTQILQAVAIKSGVEHWRRNRGRCMGALYWQINDNWPVASWSSIDYFGRWKALHYFAKNFYAPVSGSIVRILDENKEFTLVDAYVQNESLEKSKVKVRMTLKTMDFQEITTLEETVIVGPLSSLRVCGSSFHDYLKVEEKISISPRERKMNQGVYHRADVFVETAFIYESGFIQWESETLLAYKHMNLPKSKVDVKVEETSEEYIISLQTDHYTAFVELDFLKEDVIFENNYINITSQEPRKILLAKKDILRGTFTGKDDVKEKLIVRSIRDTY
ncbi:MAG TPA: glycoside hydrolase family 2 protein [Lachnospiraceae bacterium]|nr:glycoside hydrolase family 2 protein [Lachnospiraceae bacterium]